MRFIAFALGILTLGLSQSAWALEPFVYDGCTYFPEGTHQDPALWEHCCLEHDLRFWAGGSRPDRDRADLRLRECVRDAGAPEVADLMYFGVRVGSLWPRKIPGKTWNNAWATRPRYQALTASDVTLIEQDIRLYDLPADQVDQLLEKVRREAQRTLSWN